MSIFRFSLAVCAAWLLSAGAAAAVEELPLLEGWKPVTAQDMKGTPNEDRRKQKRFGGLIAAGDFDGDGRQDAVRLVQTDDGKSFGLMLSLHEESSRVSHQLLFQFRSREEMSQYGVQRVEPGTYMTACGAGYWSCEPGQPKTITLSEPGIDFFGFDGASLYIWWDPSQKDFEQTTMAD